MLQCYNVKSVFFLFLHCQMVEENIIYIFIFILSYILYVYLCIIYYSLLLCIVAVFSDYRNHIVTLWHLAFPLLPCRCQDGVLMLYEEAGAFLILWLFSSRSGGEACVCMRMTGTLAVWWRICGRWAAGVVLTQMLAIVNGETLSKASVKLRYSSALASP